MPKRQPLGEVFGRHGTAADQAAGGGIHFPEGGLSVQAGALEQGTVLENQALRERGRIVGDFGEHLRYQNRRGRSPLRARGMEAAE